MGRRIRPLVSSAQASTGGPLADDHTAARRFRPLIIGFVATFVLFLVYLGLAGAKWPGPPDACLQEGLDVCWCEVVGPEKDFVRQPHNTWSNLGFILSGLGILLWVAFDREKDASPNHANPMTAGGLFPVLYGAIALLMGWASFFFHGSMTQYGGYIDSVSLYAFTSYLIAYNVMRIWRWEPGWFHALFWGLLVVVSGVNLGLVLEDVETWPTVLVGILGIGALLFEIWSWAAKSLKRNYIGIVFFLVSLVTAGTVWALSATGRPLCEPDGDWQGHAIWHGLTATCTFLFFLYARTEDEVAEEDGAS